MTRSPVPRTYTPATPKDSLSPRSTAYYTHTRCELQWLRLSSSSSASRRPSLLSSCTGTAASTITSAKYASIPRIGATRSAPPARLLQLSSGMPSPEARSLWSSMTSSVKEDPSWGLRRQVPSSLQSPRVAKFGRLSCRQRTVMNQHEESCTRAMRRVTSFSNLLTIRQRGCRSEAR